jgi:methionine synthase II (cobalamin-independent)
MNALKGLATGIGSLPYKDAETALDLIFKFTPDIPFWPQLPKRDPKEGMIAQFSENFPFLKVGQGGIIFSNLDSPDRELEIFYEHIIANDIDYFKISDSFALGLHKFYQRLEKSDLKDLEFIKCQITGPFTFAASIKDQGGIALLHDPVFMQVIIKGLAMKALWQIKLFKKFGKKIILFIDEPYLGCFGSAYTPINREDVVKGLIDLTLGIRSENVLIGVHCCGNTDWTIFTDVETIDIINFDASGFQDEFLLYPEDLGNFLKRGGIICWGIVPTQEFSGKETPELLIGKIKAGIDTLVKKGVDKELLLENLIISPSCGLGTLDTEKSEKIFQLLSETSALIKKSL